jgi:hypothetical protein
MTAVPFKKFEMVPGKKSQAHVIGMRILFLAKCDGEGV